MSYNDFLSFIGNGCNLFYQSLMIISNYLIHNWIFMTILGLSIFTGLFYLFVNNILFNFHDNVCNNCDDFIYSKRRYNLFHEVRYNFLQTNEKDVYLYRMANLKINRNVFDNYLSNNKDLEFSIRTKTGEINNDVYRVIKSTNNNDVDIFNHWENVLNGNERTATKEELEETKNILDNF